ncbi:MAG: hypothetical protein H6839_07860 [Planctomycetes bacterium]|nr:hypothetical protein [Planctomycetota bacterium]
MDELIVGVNLFAICFVLAAMEVHIEGPNGWATTLPTWRFDRPWLRKLTNGKPITGYHVYINLVILGFLHYPLILSKWTFVGELRILSQYLMVAVWWDFLWFVINPHFGIRRFKSKNVWWHKQWIAGMPMDYPMGTICSAALWFWADWLQPGPAITIFAWAKLLGIVIGLTALTAVVMEIIGRHRPGKPLPDGQPAEPAP